MLRRRTPSTAQSLRVAILTADALLWSDPAAAHDRILQERVLFPFELGSCSRGSILWSDSVLLNTDQPGAALDPAPPCRRPSDEVPRCHATQHSQLPARGRLALSREHGRLTESSSPALPHPERRHSRAGHRRWQQRAGLSLCCWCGACESDHDGRRLDVSRRRSLEDCYAAPADTDRTRPTTDCRRRGCTAPLLPSTRPGRQAACCADDRSTMSAAMTGSAGAADD